MNQKSDNRPDGSEEHSDDELWLKGKIQQHLDTEVENLDFNVTSKLSAARHRALDQSTSDTTRSGSDSTAWKPWFNTRNLAGGTAVLTLAVLIGNQLYPPAAIQTPTMQIPTENSTLASSDLMEDLTLLSSSDDLEFYQSIEFLEWIESNS